MQKSTKIGLSIILLILITGCNIRSWDDVVTECQEKDYSESCGYLKCLQENSAGFSDDTKNEIKSNYDRCQLIQCQAQLIAKTIDYDKCFFALSFNSS